MSNTTEDRITAMVPSTGTSVAKFGDAAEVRMKLQIMRASVPGLSKKKRQNVGGRWVETDEYVVPDELVVALVVAEARSGLSAARGEIGVIPGSGLYVATKVKVADAIRAAAERRDPFVPEFRKVVTSDLDPLWAIAQREYGAEPGDTVAAVTLRRHVATQAWYAQRNAKIDELTKLGFRGQQALDMVNTEFGDRAPTCVALGIVKGSENFSGGGDDDVSRWRPREAAEAAKWDEKQAEKKARSEAIYSRYDRACKRALSRALAQYGLAAPDQRNYGSAAPYMASDEDSATPATLIASATLSDTEADMRRAQLEAEVIASTLAPPPPPPPPTEPASPQASSARARITNRDEDLDSQPPLIVEGQSRVAADKAERPSMSEDYRKALNRAADWLEANRRISADNLPQLKAHMATLRWKAPESVAGDANGARRLFAQFVGEQIGGEVTV